MAVSETDICNRGLQKIGSKRITSLAEESSLARECAACYAIVRDAELRTYVWSFSVERVILSSVVGDSVFGDAERFQVPSDFIRLAPYFLPEFQYDDLEREGDYLLSTLRGGTLNLRYAKRVTDTTKFDPLFVEALATKIALELVERITESNTKKQILMVEYDQAISKAKQVNAIEKPPVEAPVGDWIAARY